MTASVRLVVRRGPGGTSRQGATISERQAGGVGLYGRFSRRISAASQAVAGPFVLFHEQIDGHEVTVNVALPVAEQRAGLYPARRQRLIRAFLAGRNL